MKELGGVVAYREQWQSGRRVGQTSSIQRGRGQRRGVSLETQPPGTAVRRKRHTTTPPGEQLVVPDAHVLTGQAHLMLGVDQTRLGTSLRANHERRRDRPVQDRRRNLGVV